MRRILVPGAVGLVALAGVLAVRTATIPARQVVVPPAPAPAIDADAAARRLARALTFPTISHEDPARFDPAPFRAFTAWLAETYPRTHAALARETVRDHSLLYRWDGTDPRRAPVLLLAHIDVVPVEPGTEDRWTHPAFGGVIGDGFVWGRGALDDKGSLLSILEAVELLLAEGFAPAATVYLAFGHDEEVAATGAAAMAALLAARGVRAAFALDEGGFIVRDPALGTDRPVAVVGTAEKGSVSVELVARGTGGHSSVPPPDPAIGILATALARLLASPMPSRLVPTARGLLDHLAPELPWPRRLVLANLWLFGPLVERALASTPAGAALVRTTTAPTILEAGVKQNVLPAAARAVVNFRTLPGDSVADVLAHVRRAVGDPRVEAEPLPGAREASPESPLDAPALALLQRTVAEVFPEALFAPYLTLGGTDARHYVTVTDNIYRFLPVVATDADRARIHGTDERIAVEAHARAIAFMVRLLRNAAGPEGALAAGGAAAQ